MAARRSATARRRDARHLLAGLMLAAQVPTGLAVGAAVADESVFFDEPPLVLTASRLTQSAFDAPAPITVLDREAILASGFTEIHDLLRLVPGFLVADWPGGSPTVTNHGLGDAYGRRIKVMIDGRTVNNPFRGDVDWQDLPIRVDDIDRIEVVRGPHGGAYGANAFLGVVNILTRSPRTEAGQAVILRGGHNGISDLGVRLNSDVGSPIDWRLSTSQRTADNFHSYRNYAEEAIHRKVFNLDSTLQLDTRDEIRFQAGATAGWDESGEASDPLDPVRKTRLRDHYLRLGWHRTYDAESELSLQYFHYDSSRRVAWIAPLDTPFGRFHLPLDADVDSQRDEIELQHSHRFNPAWHLLWGAAVRRDAVRSARFFTRDEAETGTQWQLFASLSWKPQPQWLVNAGATMERHYNSGRLFSSRLAANYALAPQTALRASTGVAYRAPSMWEARSYETSRYEGDIAAIAGKIIAIGYWSTLPLKPERVRFTETGVVTRFDNLGMELDARLFRERHTRYIDDQLCHFPPDRDDDMCAFAPPADALLLRPTTSYFVNSGGVTMEGAEARIDWRHPEFGRILLSQAFINLEQHSGRSDSDLDLSGPQSMTSLLLIKPLPGRWQASLGFYHSTSFKWLNDGDRISSQGRTDLKIAKMFGPTGSENEISLTLQSLEGRYRDFHEGRYRHEAAAFATLRLSL